MFKKRNLSVKLIILSLFFIIISCEKDNFCRATILIVDLNNNPVSGANVKLWIPNSSLEYPGKQTINWPEQITESDGQAFFVFKNESVLEIEAKKGALFGTGFIVLKRGLNVQQQVILN